ncbi:translation initiation factor IF-3 [Ehrlichia ruminantium]|uniref:Translation initiation factor IF-3 n=1 Tax=Ehrlichia ruminantium TaxID=779 RepID=A0AAE6QBQ9_EHRRU|nr:translation initiation factor IF-3 [Ehrlichia ruminantium]QGR02953.1 translation initiation factor IF-3 [Ehrlichia ruminantium]QGR03878.1 translation initiation factor IF-3 [Ehrlichia ruminantium]QGR04803.1 translation initiation factor IF-3 [Ehrlichia ruminantium]
MKSNKFSNKNKINEMITAKKVKLVDQDSVMIGIVDIEEALSRAKAVNLDLVEIVHNDEYPLCKIFDYSKYRYSHKKKISDSKKKQKTIIVKELKFKLNIGDNDYNVKLNMIRGFIERGDKVKISLKFIGREILHPEVGMEIIERLIKDTSDIAKPENSPKREGNLINMILTTK